MKKFRCYKCGTVSTADDSATMAKCPVCGTVCSFGAPKPQAAAAEKAGVQTDLAEHNALAAQNGAPVPVNANTPAKNTFHQGNARISQGGSEYAEKAAIVNILSSYVSQKDYRTLLNAVMNAPVERARDALAANVKSWKVTFLFSYLLMFTGIDRLYAGYVALGVCKWIFGAATFFIWNFVDLFICYKSARKKNMEKILATLGMAPNPVH